MDNLPLEPEAFAAHVMSLLKRQYPTRDSAVTGPLHVVFDGRHLGLENLYRMVLRDPRNANEIVENYLERLLEGDQISGAPLPFSVARTRIMPRIQPESIFEHLDRAQVAHIPFVNDTVIVFVIDLPQLTVSITTEQMVRWVCKRMISTRSHEKTSGAMHLISKCVSSIRTTEGERRLWRSKMAMTQRVCFCRHYMVVLPKR